VVSNVRALIPNLPRRAWIVLGGDALSALGSGLTLPFFIVYLHRVRGIDLGLAGLALSTLAVAGLAGNPIGGSLTDRFGARKTMILALLISAAGAVAAALVREAWHGFAAAAIVGFGAAVIWPAQDSLLANSVSARQRSSVFSVRHATLNAGFGLGGVGAALVIDVSAPTTFEFVYLLDALSFLIFIPILMRLPDDDRSLIAETSKGARLGYRDIFRDKVFLRLLALTALLILVGYAQYHAAFPAFATEVGELSMRALGIAFAANTFVVVAVQLVVLKMMTGRLRTHGLMLLCGFWAAAWAATLLGGEVGGVLSVSLFVSAMALFGVGETLMSPTMPAIVNDLAPDELRGRYNGVYTLAWTSGFMVGPALAGAALASGFDTELFIALIGLCGVAAVVAARLEHHLPQEVNRVRAGDTAAGEVVIAEFGAAAQREAVPA
jgi:MFS family permease